MQTITLTEYANARDLPLSDAISQAVADDALNILYRVLINDTRA